MGRGSYPLIILNKLKPVWVGPLVVFDVLNPVLFRVKDSESKSKFYKLIMMEYVLHHDRLKRCEDHHIPLWLCKLHHGLLDLDTTIKCDEVEQEDLSPPSVPKVPVENDSHLLPGMRSLRTPPSPLCQLRWILVLGSLSC